MLSVLSAAQREDAPSDVSHRRIDVNPSGKYPRGFRAGVGAPARGGPIGIETRALGDVVFEAIEGARCTHGARRRDNRGRRPWKRRA